VIGFSCRSHRRAPAGQSAQSSRCHAGIPFGQDRRAAGRRISSQYRERAALDVSEADLRENATAPADRFPPSHRFRNAMRLFSLYLKHLASRHEPGWHPCVLHVHNAIEASTNSLDAARLGLCVAVEGLANLVPVSVPAGSGPPDEPYGPPSLDADRADILETSARAEHGDWFRGLRQLPQPGQPGRQALSLGWMGGPNV
jgi:hypothetical protein